jgi:glycosyltransferase involved in cell wall biosynthesis
MPRVLLALAPTIALIVVATALWLSQAPHVLILWPDSYGYLAPSLSALSGGDFTHVHGRGFVYPLVVYGSLLAFDNLSGLIYVQAACYFATLVLLITLLWVFRTGSIVAGALSFLLAVVYLGYAPLTDLIQAVMAEVFWSFLAVLSTAALILAQRVKSGATFVVLMAVSLYASSANFLVKPQWLFAAAFLTFVWLIVLFTAELRAKWTMLLAMAALVTSTLVVPEICLAAKYDARSSSLFAPKTLFCNHADIIVRASADDPGFWAGQPAEFAQDTMTKLQATVALGPRGWPLLGFDGDVCMYGENNPDALVRRQFSDDLPSMRAFYLSTFLRAVAAEPLAYGRKIGWQMWSVLQQPFQDADLQIEASDNHMHERSLHPELARIYPPLQGTVQGFMARYLPYRISVRIRQAIESHLWLPVLGIIFAFALVMRRNSWNPLFAIAVLTGAWFAESLTAAASHSFDAARYRWMGAPLLMGAIFMSVAWASGTLAARLRAPKLATRVLRMLVERAGDQLRPALTRDLAWTILPDGIRSESHHSWTVKLSARCPRGELAESRPTHFLRLFEDKMELGPAWSLHDDIRKFGAGRYSHWGGRLFFSSSDNTSPAANGRRYRLLLERLDQRDLISQVQDIVNLDFTLPSTCVSGPRQKILLVAASLGPGGAERQWCYLARGLKQLGFDVTFAVTGNLNGPNGHYRPLLQELDLEPIIIEQYRGDHQGETSDEAMMRLRSLEAAAWFMHPLSGFVSLLLALKPHAIIAQLDSPNLISGLAGQLAGVPQIVMSFHSSNPDNFPFSDATYRPLYQAFSRLRHIRMTAVANSSRADYAAWMGRSDAEIAVIPCALDPAGMNRAADEDIRSLRNELGISEHAPTVLGVFRLSQEKRPFVFIDVCATIAAAFPNLVVLLAGDGPQREEVERRVSERGLSGVIRLLGRRDDVGVLYCLADMLLHTAAIEAMPNVLLEAQALGIPVVAAATGAVPELVLHGKTGYLSAIDDIEGLAHRSIELLSDPVLARHMGQAGIEHVKQFADIEAMARQYLKLVGLVTPSSSAPMANLSDHALQGATGVS